MCNKFDQNIDDMDNDELRRKSPGDRGYIHEPQSARYLRKHSLLDSGNTPDRAFSPKSERKSSNGKYKKRIKELEKENDDLIE